MALSSRPLFDAFISYSHADRVVVDRLQRWLGETAGLSLWRDSEAMPASSHITRTLEEAIASSQAMVVVLSRKSLASGWAEAERDVAIIRRLQGKALPSRQRFRLVPVRIDDSINESDIPAFLAAVKWIDALGGQLDLSTADQFLTALADWHSADEEPRRSRDVYVARSWRDEEAAFADAVCVRLIGAGFRLIGDSTDQPGFDPDRIQRIIRSCGALVAILPDRGGGRTSRYILQEVELACHLGVPYLLTSEVGIEVPETFLENAVDRQLFTIPTESQVDGLPEDIIETFCMHWREPMSPHYVFFATDFGEEHVQRRDVVRRLVERVTALPCYMGDDFKDEKQITERIAAAELVIADISERNINSCIEAGIALGAGRPLRLITSSSRREAPFMFRTRQQERYTDDAELLGTVHRIVRPYRRRIINRELSQ